jgi:hypothetical protein
MENNTTKLNKFLGKEDQAKKASEEVVVNQRDGLFERRELINPKHVTRDGREDKFQA